jgi:hypothetical protein
MNLNNNNNNPPMSAKTRRQRKREYNATPQNQPQPKRQKPNPGEQTRQRKRTARNARAFADRALAGKGRTKNGTTNRANFVIEEDEYIAEVTPANEPAFNVVQYPVNPGQVGTFPWLSTIAKNFEKYCFEYLEFYYKREVSEFATNGQTGKVIYSFDTDASDPAPFGKQEMEATDPHEDALPSENFRLPIPPKMLVPVLTDAHFVRPGALPANADLKTYDVGTLNVATQATAANTATGELHVRYRVRLMIPILPPGGAQGASVVLPNIVPTTAAPFGTSTVVTGAIGATVAAQVITFANVQVGTEIAINVGVEGTVVTGLTLNTPVGMTVKTGPENNLINGAATIAAAWATYNVTALNPSITVTPAATTYAASQMFVQVCAPAAGI